MPRRNRQRGKLRRRRRPAADDLQLLQEAATYAGLPPGPPFAFETGEAQRPSMAPICGACREWLEGEPGLRGTCLPPGSGIMHPWPDTPGCPFFQARRR